MMPKILTTMITLLLLTSTIATLSSKADICNLVDENVGNPLEPVEVKKTIWDNNQWVNEINTNIDESIRFNITVTYHDTDGEGGGFKLININITDKLPSGLDYFDNASRPADYLSDDGRIISWNLTGEIELTNNTSYSLEFDVKTISNGIYTNIANVSALEIGSCFHKQRWGEAEATIIVGQYYNLTINVEGNGTTDPAPGTYSYLSSTEVELNAIADQGWKFVNWSGAISSDDNPIAIVIDSDKTVTAHFTNKTTNPPTVEITRPMEKSIYWFNFRIPRLFNDEVWIIGPIKVKAKVVKGDIDIDRVEFQIDGKTKHTERFYPYDWIWLVKPFDLKKKYTITVVAYDKEGNSGSDTIDVIRTRPILLGLGLLYLLLNKNKVSGPNEKKLVNNTAPIVNLNGPYTGVEDIPITFDGSGSYDPDNDKLTYEWDFGDGTNGTGEKPSHTYKDPGEYTLTLTVTDSRGLSASNTTKVYISPSKKIAPPEESSPQDGNLFWYIVGGLSITLFALLAAIRLRRKLYV